MKYRKMIESAKQKGLATTDKMWQSICSVEDMLDEIEDESVVNKFIRKQHEILYGEHYDEEMARCDLDDICYTDRDGSKRYGAHWTCAETEVAMRGKLFNSDITKYDIWVALNSMYADTCSILSDEQIIDVAYEFYFDDEDWPCKDCKIWQYMSAREWFERKSGR